MTTAEQPDAAEIREDLPDLPDLPEALQSGARLDADHAPETNGRQAVCRRCGFRTDGPLGNHLARDPQGTSVDKWLDAEAFRSSVAHWKGQRDN